MDGCCVLYGFTIQDGRRMKKKKKKKKRKRVSDLTIDTIPPLACNCRMARFEKVFP
jgi:hypothetical protein